MGGQPRPETLRLMMQHLMAAAKGGLDWTELLDWTWDEMKEQSEANSSLQKIYARSAKERGG